MTDVSARADDRSMAGKIQGLGGKFGKQVTEAGIAFVGDILRFSFSPAASPKSPDNRERKREKNGKKHGRKERKKKGRKEERKKERKKERKNWKGLERYVKAE
jgi:hypothetical protein